MPSLENEAQTSDRVVTQTVARRWTEPLAKRGWTPVCHALLDHYRDLSPALTTIEVMLVIQIIRYKWDERLPFPSLKRVARKMGLGSTSIRNYVRSLENKGYLKRVYRNGSTNAFDFTQLFAALEEIRGVMEVVNDIEEAERRARMSVI